MKFRPFKLTLVLAILISTSFSATSLAAGNSNSKSPNENAIGYWNQDRLDGALSRDFEFEPGAKSGKLVAQGKSTRGGGGSTTSITGSSWTKGGLPLLATGKVFFTMGNVNYVCSGALANETVSARSIVLTAGHCVWDDTSAAFATNFIFIPAYDSNPVNNCSTSLGRCLSASALVASSGFTSQTTFTTQATNYDWGFAVVNETPQPGFDLAVNALSTNSIINAFGYPQGQPYNGTKLIYCSGPITADAKNLGLTWGLGCNMTDGASGGPWLSSFDSKTFTGKLASVNSYKYRNDSKRMYGPNFNSATQATFDAAKLANGNTIVN